MTASERMDLHKRTRAKLEDFRARMPAHLEADGLELFRSIAQGAPVQAESLLEWLPDLTRILPAEVAEEGIGHGVRIARASVMASYEFLSHLHHLSNTLGSGNLGPWVDEGLRLLEQNPSAGPFEDPGKGKGEEGHSFSLVIWGHP